DATCADSDDGEIAFTAMGGTAPYKYSINNGISFFNASTFTDLPIGTYNVVVRDNNNCLAPVQMVEIEVGDVTPPTITCPANETEAAPPGFCEADVTVGSASVNDNCMVTSVVNDFNNTDDASDTYPLGTTTVEWTVTDASGNTATCSMTVTVTDNEDPMAVCNDITVSLNAMGSIVVDAELVDDGSSDLCGPIDQFFLDDSTFTCMDLGDNMVVLTVVDVNGNTDQCDAIITVEDNLAPVITCPANVMANTDMGTCVATGVMLGMPTMVDNCGMPSASNNAPAGYMLGANTVTWTATDASGNMATCEQTVTVQDNQDPMITCPAGFTVDTDPGQCTATGVMLGSASASDNCSGSPAVSNNGSEPYGLGNTTVTWTANDGNGNTASCDQVITVQDNEDPEITCPAGVTVNTDMGVCEATGVMLGMPVVTDNCATTPSTNNAPASFPLGTTTVTWTAHDTSGNTDSCDQEVTVEDNQDPVISCPAGFTVDTDMGACTATGVMLGMATATDNCTGSPTITNNAPASYMLGANTVTWTATDDNGNMDTCDQVITVEDNEMPSVICPANVMVDADMGACVATNVMFSSATASDNCAASPSLSSDYNSGDDFMVGTTVVTFTANDGNGNINTCQFSVIVEDDQDPIVSCPAVFSDL
ncbi:HYR domain-containing protein, partial [Candidatus Saccharibacteria bacterium]|nr:HYR domain-containing protein [Candidatus Saccharibacteria bacterium]